MGMQENLVAGYQKIMEEQQKPNNQKSYITSDLERTSFFMINKTKLKREIRNHTQ